MDTRRVLEDYLLEGELEERKRKLEIAWDVYQFLPYVWEKIKRDFFDARVKPLIRQAIGEAFYVKEVIFKDEVHYFNFRITKNSWTVEGDLVYCIKMDRERNGNYKIYIENRKEKWFPSSLKEKQKDLVSQVLKFENSDLIETREGIPFSKFYIAGDNLTGIDFVTHLITSPVDEAERILGILNDFSRILRFKTENNKTVEETLTEIVQLFKTIQT